MAEEKKIIVDEDWKSQVEAEKASFAKETEAARTATTDNQQLPPASFEMLVTTFATEAMVALGQLPNPYSNEHSVNLEHARYSIDMLDVLEDKTKGNLTADEAGMIEGLLHQLRMAFVMVKNQFGAADGGSPTSPIVQP